MGAKVLVVVVVLTSACVLTAFLPSPIGCGFRDNQSTRIRVQIAEIEGALDLFRIDVGRYPTTSEGLKALVENPDVPWWAGPYLKMRSVPKDPWGKTFYYSIDSSGRSYDVWTYGADGLPGGEYLAGDCHTDECECREPPPPSLVRCRLSNAFGWLVFIPLILVRELIRFVTSQ